jgi:hypothetical protein
MSSALDALLAASLELPFKDAKEQLIDAFARTYVAALLERHGGNVSRAARAAGLSRKHLYELLRRPSPGGNRAPAAQPHAPCVHTQDQEHGRLEELPWRGACSSSTAPRGET